MRRPLSLALRLTLLFGVASAVVFPIVGLVIVKSTENHFRDMDSDELQIIAHAVQDALASKIAASDIGGLEQRFDDILVGHHDAMLRIAASDGRVLFSSSTPDLSDIAQSITVSDQVPTVHLWAKDDHSYRVLVQTMRKDLSEPLRVIVAVPIDHHQQFLAIFQRNLWLMITASIALMGVMGWVAVRQGHAPLRDIVDKIQRISADGLDRRLSPQSVPSELSELATSFNGMLQRVDKAFHRLSDFNADMAHELRTPIANLMTQTQVALTRARTIDEYREILYSNMEEYERMAQMVADMLFLAQAENPQPTRSFVDLDLASEVRNLFDYYEGWAEESGVALALTGNASVSGDRLMLQRALGNLLSNAIRHTPSGGTVTVALKTAASNSVTVSVENPGIDISPEHLSRLFDRFYRVDSSRQKGDEGVGLGLSIVASIASAHDGEIEVVSADGRTRFVMTLPRRLKDIKT